MGIFLWVAYISNISLGMPDVPGIFRELTVEAWSKSTYEAKMKISLWGPILLRNPIAL